MSRPKPVLPHHITRSASQPANQTSLRASSPPGLPLRTHDIQALQQHLGESLEVVGCVTTVTRKQTKSGKPFVFVNFGDWKQHCFRLVFWSEQLDHFVRNGIDLQTFTGKWLSVHGVLEQYQTGSGVTQYQILPRQPTQITVLRDEAEALQRCAARAQAYQPPASMPPAAEASTLTGAKLSSPALPAVTSVTGPTVTLERASTTSERPLVCSFCTHQVRAQSNICGQCGVPQHPATRLHPGETLCHRYTVQRTLSRGGMGEIYLARDGNLFDRQVVIKVMLDYFNAGDPREVQEAHRMFEHEARILATLNHPAIPNIHDFFRIAHDAYIVMEWISGSDLEQGLTHLDLAGRTVSGQPYPLEVGIQYGLEVARVLQYLAEVADGPVMHLDIKPANILRDSSDRIRLVDFGAARPGASGTGQTRQTALYGTPGYAPPEQYYGRTEPRSDIFALAATIYHLVTDDDPRTHPSSFPQLGQLGDLEQALTPALHVQVTERPTIQEFVTLLEQLLVQHPSQAQLDEIQRKQAQLDQELQRVSAEARRREEAVAEKQRELEATARRRQEHLDEERRKVEKESRRRREELEAEQRKAKEQHRQDQLRRAPDGTLLLSSNDLVRWSEQHWQQAATWIEDLPRFTEQVGVICGNAHRKFLESHAFPIGSLHKHVALDSILALLDPTGFGREEAQIGVDKKKLLLDFGILTAQERPIPVMIKNTGRRYCQVDIVGPDWIRASEAPMSLLPGTEQAMTFIAQLQLDGQSFTGESKLEIQVNGKRAGTLQICAELPSKGLLARLRRAIPGLLRND